MKRKDLEHVLRAAADIADDSELIVIGSQAILGQYPNPPDTLTVSIEADLIPKNKPERWDVVDGSIGEGSPFHETFGYYAQGVERSTAILPTGWEERLVPICNENTRGVTGWCLEPHDLILSKLVAARPKDLTFFRDAHAHGLVRKEVLHQRLELLPVSDEKRYAIRTVLNAG